MEHMIRQKKQSVIDGDRVFKASNVKNPEPVSLEIAHSLTRVNMLRFIKIYNDSLCASNLLSDNGLKEPLVDTERTDLVGVELLIDPAFKTVQFFSIVSFKKGYGRQMVAAVVEATPENWAIAVVMDWSGGFWQKMQEEYPRIMIF